MSEGTKSEILQLFTDKLDEIRAEFESERVRRRKMLNGFIVGFGIMILTFVFSAGVIVQKVNSLEKNYYKVAEKVETLYLVAVQKGDIKLDIRTRGE